MQRLRTHGFFLLGALTISMVAAPEAHRLEHALHHRYERAQIVRQTDHVHADFAAFSKALQDVSHGTFGCAFCTTAQRASLQFQSSSLAVDRRDRSYGILSRALASRPATDKSARAPPLAA